MSLTVEAKIGKKFTVYLPKVVVQSLDLKEGERILLKVKGDNLVMEPLRDPIQLALTGKKFASLTPEEAERISIEEQAAQTKHSA